MGTVVRYCQAGVVGPVLWGFASVRPDLYVLLYPTIKQRVFFKRLSLRNNRSIWTSWYMSPLSSEILHLTWLLARYVQKRSVLSSIMWAIRPRITSWVRQKITAAFHGDGLARFTRSRIQKVCHRWSCSCTSSLRRVTSESSKLLTAMFDRKKRKNRKLRRRRDTLRVVVLTDCTASASAYNT
jgi:hypothetical protein